MLKPTVTLTRVLLAGALLVLAGCGGTQGNPHPAKLDAYVAMGDSFTSLAGIGPFDDDGCKRATKDYPHLVAKDLGITDFADVSCGGASSDSLTQPQRLPQNAGTRDPQLDAVDKHTKLVTIGIGMNNGAPQLSYALLYLCNRINGIINAACSAYLKLPDSDVTAAITTMAKQVGENLQQIRKRAPNARIVLVGYPRVLGDDADCPTQLPMPAAAAGRLRSAMKLVNEDLAATAKKAKVDYIDMYAASKGHDVCSSDPWVNGLYNLPGKAFQFHPYEAYHRAVADKIVALLKK